MNQSTASLRRRSTLAIALGAGALLPSGALRAQPVRTSPEGLYVTVPARVEVSLPHGAARVITREIGPLTEAEVNERIPSRTEVFEVEGGRSMPGVRLRNTLTKAVSQLEVERPVRVYLSDGHYMVERATTTLTGNAFPPGFVKDMPETAKVPVIYAALPKFGAPPDQPPSRSTPQGTVVAVPVRVDVLGNGEPPVVVVREMPPVPPERVPAVLPPEVPVFEVAADGGMLPGVRLRNETGKPTTHLEISRPVRVYIDRGAYAPEVAITACDAHEPFPPGHVKPMPESERIPVLYGPRPAGGNSRAAFDLQWIQETGTYPAGHAAEIGAALARVETRIEALLSNDTGVATIRFRFVGNGAHANTATNGFTFPFNIPRGFLQNYAAQQDESQSEINLYDAFPSTSSIPVVFQNNQSVPITDVFILAPISGKWQIGQPPESATMELDANDPWDYDTVNFIDGDKYDFEETVQHEVLHVLGFGSLLERPQHDRISLFDLFRLRHASPIPNFTTSPRMLQPNVEAVTIGALNLVTRAYRMSTGTTVVGGDGSEAGHWKADEITSFYLGLMDPTQHQGFYPLVHAGYLSDADLNALDILGWNFDPVDFQRPARPLLQRPTPGQPHVSLSPTFEWTPGSADSNLFVFEGEDPVQTAQVYKARDLVGSNQPP
jgi:hypothetical protein